MRRTLALGTVVAASLLWPAAAMGADAVVTVGPDKTLSPAGGNATINPDDNVTWRWAAGSDKHHIASIARTGPEVWDSGVRTTGEFAHTFVKSGSFAYHCVLHPNDMRGTVTVTGAPRAELAPPSPAQPFTGEAVSLDGSASSDPDGAIVSYAWDFEGNGTFDETNATATTSHAYPAPGTFAVRLRVTDDRGNTHDATRSIVVRSRVPTASFTATPLSVGKGQDVSFDGSGSRDDDGTIVKYEWDLDGAGFVEGSVTMSRHYAAAGVVTVKLRVTDNDGRTAEAAKTVTVINAAPAAVLTASTTTPYSGADVTFDAGGSADTDGGTIAAYQWDLDGNGSFETAGGTTPTITRRFATAGRVTVRVRVTDDEGATADASVTLDVTAPAQPTEPAAPAQPSQPTSPTQPTEIASPSPPMESQASAQPTQPSDPGPVPIPTPTAAPHTSTTATAPVASGLRAQRLRRQRAVRVRVSCPAACRLVLGGSVKVGGRRLRLGTVARTLSAGQAATVTVQVDRRDLGTLRRARGKGTASIRLAATFGSHTVVRTLVVAVAA